MKHSRHTFRKRVRGAGTDHGMRLCSLLICSLGFGAVAALQMRIVEPATDGYFELGVEVQFNIEVDGLPANTKDLHVSVLFNGRELEEVGWLNALPTTNPGHRTLRGGRAFHNPGVIVADVEVVVADETCMQLGNCSSTTSSSQFTTVQNTIQVSILNITVCTHCGPHPSHILNFSVRSLVKPNRTFACESSVLILEVDSQRSKTSFEMCFAEHDSVAKTFRGEMIIPPLTAGQVVLLSFQGRANECETESDFLPLAEDQVQISDVSEETGTRLQFRKRYSSFECNDTGGARTCVLRDVCWRNRRIEYYMDSLEEQSLSDMSMAAYQGKLVQLLGLEAKLQGDTDVEEHVLTPAMGRFGWFSPSIKRHTRSRTSAYSPQEVSVLDTRGIAFNFGHFILEQMLPHIAALHIFNLTEHGHDTQLVSRWSCSHFRLLFSHVAGTSPDSKVGLCERMYAEWVHPYFFDAPPLILTGPDNLPATDVCFARLIVGQNAAFSPLIHRRLPLGHFARSLRNRVWERAGVGLQVASSSSRANGANWVLALPKTSGWTTRVLWPRMCDDVESALVRNGLRVQRVPVRAAEEEDDAEEKRRRKAGGEGRKSGESENEVRMRCVDPAKLSFREQVRVVAEASVTVSYDGTLSVLMLFARAGAAGLVVGPTPFKEQDTLPPLSSASLLYLDVENVHEELQGVLRTLWEGVQDPPPPPALPATASSAGGTESHAVEVKQAGGSSPSKRDAAHTTESGSGSEAGGEEAAHAAVVRSQREEEPSVSVEEEEPSAEEAAAELELFVDEIAEDACAGHTAAFSACMEPHQTATAGGGDKGERDSAGSGSVKNPMHHNWQHCLRERSAARECFAGMARRIRELVDRRALEERGWGEDARGRGGGGGRGGEDRLGLGAWKEEGDETREIEAMARACEQSSREGGAEKREDVLQRSKAAQGREGGSEDFSTRIHEAVVRARGVAARRREEFAGMLEASDSTREVVTRGVWLGIAESKYAFGASLLRAHASCEHKQPLQTFATLIPGLPSTYIFKTEQAYYSAYSKALFAVTMFKGGWDCLRHYEIIAAGSIPFFLDIDRIPTDIMRGFPRELVMEAMMLPGVPSQDEVREHIRAGLLHSLHVDASLFDLARYCELLKRIVASAVEFATPSAVGGYVLELLAALRPGLSQPKVLLIADDSVEYLSGTLYAGLFTILGADFSAFHGPKRILHRSFPPSGDHSSYGRGFSYARTLPDPALSDREAYTQVLERLGSGAFNVVIFANAQNGHCSMVDYARRFGGRLKPAVLAAYLVAHNPLLVTVDGSDVGGCHNFFAKDAIKPRPHLHLYREVPPDPALWHADGRASSSLHPEPGCAHQADGTCVDHDRAAPEAVPAARDPVTGGVSETGTEPGMGKERKEEGSGTRGSAAGCAIAEPLDGSTLVLSADGKVAAESQHLRGSCWLDAESRMDPRARGADDGSACWAELAMDGRTLAAFRPQRGRAGAELDDGRETIEVEWALYEADPGVAVLGLTLFCAPPRRSLRASECANSTGSDAACRSRTGPQSTWRDTDALVMASSSGLLVLHEPDLVDKHECVPRASPTSVLTLQRPQLQYLSALASTLITEYTVDVALALEGCAGAAQDTPLRLQAWYYAVSASGAVGRMPLAQAHAAEDTVTLALAGQGTHRVLVELLSTDGLQRVLRMQLLALQIQRTPHSKRVCYLVQSARPIALGHLHSAESEVIQLAWRDLPDSEGADAGVIFLPNSTWVRGRNRLFEEVARRYPTTEFQYVVFVDEDAELREKHDFGSNTGHAWRTFERYLTEWEPAVAVPNMFEAPYASVKSEVFTLSLFDQIVVAYHWETWAVLLPYTELFDDQSWWYCALVHCMLCNAFYPNHRVVLNAVEVLNHQHTTAGGVYKRGTHFQIPASWIASALTDLDLLRRIPLENPAELGVDKYGTATKRAPDQPLSAWFLNPTVDFETLQPRRDTAGRAPPSSWRQQLQYDPAHPYFARRHLLQPFGQVDIHTPDSTPTPQPLARLVAQLAERVRVLEDQLAARVEPALASRAGGGS